MKIDMTNVLRPLPELIAGVQRWLAHKDDPSDALRDLKMLRDLVPRYEDVANPEIERIADLRAELDKVEAHLKTLAPIAAPIIHL